MASKVSKFNTGSPEGPNQLHPDRRWPAWARGLASVGLLIHGMAVLAGALASPPSSILEQALVLPFGGYLQRIDQGYTYRYYAPEPPPTPIATATIQYADGRPDETIRLPDRTVRPSLRYQRQLALANHLVVDFETARAMTGDGANSTWARSYARHLAKSRPGCKTITLYTQTHLIPDPERVRQELAAPGHRRVNLDAEEFYTTPERIGEFSCDAF
ncbi:hypothetical protein [Singulisphaera acidiphila]|uniref:Uncharacterized protein n=2 Tax=Singulisphaera acidiphila TaxID=466153 RepID=L0D854_SINAD|nr:hypothetical protein [Singulisphaera acidiphila]AGA25050.1 hypothetical protein Sinac_0635 [Singulisphaera acidiphila DSM 18658]